MATQRKADFPCTDEEWKLRQDLAACYRIFDHLGWGESIYNHISVKIPGEEDTFLINPFGLMYDEVTASNLVKIDVEAHEVGIEGTCPGLREACDGSQRVVGQGERQRGRVGGRRTEQRDQQHAIELLG